jgi:hypothetical protein
MVKFSSIAKLVIWTAVFTIFSFTDNPSYSQFNVLGDVIRGVQENQRRNAFKEWNELDRDIALCLEQNIKPHPKIYAQRGIGPNDEELGVPLEKCTKLVENYRSKRTSPTQTTPPSPPPPPRLLTEEERQRQKIESSMTMRLDVKKPCSMAPTWKDKGILADLEGYFFKPQLPKSYFYIGGYGTQKESGKHCVVVARSSPNNPKTAPPLLAAPKGWILVWRSIGSNAKNHGSMWQAVPPSKNYTCIGSIAQTGYDEPNRPNYRCVRSSLVDKVRTSTIIWSDEGSNADEEITVLKLPNSGSFVAVKGREESHNWFDIKTDPTMKPDSKTVDLALEKHRRKIAEAKRVEEEKRQVADEHRRKEERIKEKHRLNEKRRKLAEKKRQKIAAEKRRKIAAKKSAEEKQIKEIAAKKRTQEKRRMLLEDDANRTAVSQLFAGDPKDIVFLVNSLSKDVTRGLSGKIKILSSIARVCAISPTKFKPSNTRFEKEIFEQLSNFAKTVKIGHNVEPCKNLNVEKSEIIVLTRDISSSVSLDALSVLLKQMKKGAYDFYYVGNYQVFSQKVLAKKRELAERARKRNERKMKIETGINDGTLKGFGMFEVKHAKSNAICVEEGNEQGDIIQILQKDVLKNENGNYWQDRFTKRRITPIGTKVGNLEDIFISFKTQKCGSFFGKTESIKILTSALKRDKIVSQILPVLVGKNFIDGRRAKILAEKMKFEQEQKFHKQKEEKEIKRRDEIARAEQQRKDELARAEQQRKIEAELNKYRDHQTSFESLIETYRGQYKSFSNEVKKSKVRRLRKTAIKSMIGSTRKVKLWTGTLSSISTNSDGNAYVSIHIKGCCHIKTWNNSLSDISDNTAIIAASKLSSILENLNTGDKVWFTGRFFSDSQDHIKELSITEDGAMTDPEFLFKFSGFGKQGTVKNKVTAPKTILTKSAPSDQKVAGVQTSTPKQEQKKEPLISVTLVKTKDSKSMMDKSKRCKLTFRFENQSYGTINSLSVSLDGFDDRGERVGEVLGADADPFEFSFRKKSMPIGGSLTSTGTTFKTGCKYLRKVKAVKVPDKFCIIRNLPEKVNCLDLIRTKSEVANIEFMKL